MKYALILYSLIFIHQTAVAQAIAKNNLKEEALGRCTGSAYCSACRNCSRCGHCSNGGSCGVCSSSSLPTSSHYPVRTLSKNRQYYNATKSTRKEIKNPNSKRNVSKMNRSASFSKYNSSNVIIAATGVKVLAKELNLRSGPSLSYPTIETLKHNQELILVTKLGKWSKVKVVNSGNIGYCSSIYLYN